MRCPDWVSLTAHRFERTASEPAGWQEALAHLDACSACRRAALAIDPSLLFRNPVSTPAADVESILQGVRVLRRTSVPRRRNPWRESAAAAALFLLALWTAPATTRFAGMEVVQAAQEVRASESVPIPYVEYLPVVEAVDRPEARIYQLADDELSMVMIVDETLDV